MQVPERLLEHQIRLHWREAREAKEVFAPEPRPRLGLLVLQPLVLPRQVPQEDQMVPVPAHPKRERLAVQLEPARPKQEQPELQQEPARPKLEQPEVQQEQVRPKQAQPELQQEPVRPRQAQLEVLLVQVHPMLVRLALRRPERPRRELVVVVPAEHPMGALQVLPEQQVLDWLSDRHPEFRGYR